MTNIESWDYRGYTIELYRGELFKEYVVTKDGDEIVSFESKWEAQDYIDDIISEAFEFFCSNVETIGDRS